MIKVWVGFSRAKNPLAPLSLGIRLIEQTPYSHVYLKLYDSSIDEYFIYQASGTSVNFTNYNTFMEHSKVIEELEVHIDDQLDTKLWKFCVQNAGKPYGVKAFLGLMCVKLCGLFGKKISNPFRDEKLTYVCCELIAVLLIEILNLPFEDVDSLTPKDLYISIKELNSIHG